MGAQVRTAIAEALHFLHLAQETSAPARLGDSPNLIGDELDSVIVLWQLGLDPRFARVVRFTDLIGAIEDRGLLHDRATGPLLERVSAPAGASEPIRPRVHAA